jgi:hypothetical protein
MRDILNKIALLLESTGIAGRKPGDVFKDGKGNEIVFSDIKFYPEDGGKYTPDQMTEALSQIENKINVSWQNNRTGATGGFAIASFTSDSGPLYYGRFLKQINPNKTDNYIPNQVGDFKFAGKAAEKIQSGLTPQDLLVERDNLTQEDIISQLSNKLGDNNPLVVVAKQIASGEQLPIKFPAPEGVSFTGFRDYFCEILQPMALQNGQYTGNAGEAAELFMDGNLKDSLISFDSAKNAGLSDSILSKPNGKYIKISTKGGTGAQASVKNLVDSVNELAQSAAGKKLLMKYKDTIDLITEIQSLGQIKAPLTLGVKFDVITKDEADKILELRNTKPVNLKDIDKMKLGKNLTALAKQRSTDNPEKVNLFYHLLASVAEKSAAQVNEKTDFSNTAADILNNGALVQVYTKAKQTDAEWTLEQFDTVFPGTSIKGVYLSSSKNYFSTGIKGNFTFKIDRGGKAKPETTSGTKPDVVDLEKDLFKAAKSITRDLRPRDKKPLRRDKESTSVGREKRK